MDKVVLDTSVIVKWFLEEEDSDKAQEILAKLKNHLLQATIPNILFPELSNALYFREHLDKEILRNSLEEITKLKIEVINPDLFLFQKMTDFMTKANVAAYDALFIVLAEQMEVPLITADKKHHLKKFSKHIQYL